MRSFYSPLSISAPFYGYLKLLATRKGKESKQGCEIRESNSGPLAPRPVVMVVQEDSCRASAKRKDLSVDKQLGP